MSVIFYGDPHGRYQNLFTAVEVYQPDAVVVLGDFQLEQPLEQQLAPILDKTQVWFIAGNHDTDDDHYYQHLFQSELADRNLTGRVVDIAGLKIAGLGGVFRGKIWYPRVNDSEPKWRSRTEFMRALPRVDQRRADEFYDGLLRQHHSSIWWEDYEKLLTQSADILVTHEAPTTHQHGFSQLDDLGFALGVKRIFHGHHHLNYSAKLVRDGQRLLVEGVALASCKNEFGQVLSV